MTLVNAVWEWLEIYDPCMEPSPQDAAPPLVPSGVEKRRHNRAVQSAARRTLAHDRHFRKHHTPSVRECAVLSMAGKMQPMAIMMIRNRASIRPGIKPPIRRLAAAFRVPIRNCRNRAAEVPGISELDEFDSPVFGPPLRCIIGLHRFGLAEPLRRQPVGSYAELGYESGFDSLGAPLR